MLSRSITFGTLAASIVVVGVIGLIAFHYSSGIKVIGRGSLPDAMVHNRVNKKNVRVGQEQRSFLASIREQMTRQRRLGPMERGREDEIRCMLATLLTDTNAGAIVRGLSPEERQTEFGVSALSRWAAQDPVAAVHWLAQQPAQSEEQTWAIAQALAQDPAAIEVWCELLPATPWRETLLEDASRASFPRNPADAVRIARRMQPGSARTQVLTGIADEWSRREPENAVRWIASEPDVSLRDELLFSGAVARASIDPAGALDWANGIASTPTYARAIDKITSMWTDSATDGAYRVTVITALQRDPEIGRRRN